MDEKDYRQTDEQWAALYDLEPRRVFVSPVARDFRNNFK